MPPHFLAIVGSTASGKTDLSLAIAERTPAEVVSMDSRQVYTGMDIGTAKVSDEARSLVPHHGLDLVEPDGRYSAGRFARDARAWIREIRERQRLALLVGGTGFFLRAVLEPIFAEPPMDEGHRERLRGWLAGQPIERLEAWTRRLDPSRAETAIEGGPHRMGRTLEVALLSGRPLSWWHRHAPMEAEPTPGAVVCLQLPREVVVQRIDDRVTRMVERGLADEVTGLLDRGIPLDAPGMTGTGYREMARHVMGHCTLDEAIEDIRVATRRYSRRQQTWFRHQLPDSAVTIDALLPLDQQVDLALATWCNAGGSLPSGKGCS